VGLSRAFGALRMPEYRWWFCGQVLGASGSMTQAIALSWLILQLSPNAIYLAVVTICTWGPLLPLGPWAGALVDRADRRRLLMVTQTLLSLFSLLLAVLTATGTIRLWSLFAISLATGTVTTVDAPARQVYVADIVGSSGIASAVSLYEVVINLSRVLGPAVGGLLLFTVGIAPCFVVNAASFLAPLAVLVRTRKVRATGHAIARERGAIRAGLRYVRRAPAIRACVLLAAAGGMLFNLSVALPLFTTRVLHLGGAGFGLMMAAFGVGALPGAALSALTTLPTGRRVRLLSVATGLAVVLVASAPNAPVAFLGMAVAGFASIWFIALANTLVQVESDPAVRGRVLSVWNMSLLGTMPVTSLLTAWISQSLGARAGFAASGVALLVCVAVGWRALGSHVPGPAHVEVTVEA
jgi:MFS family permease